MNRQILLLLFLSPLALGFRPEPRQGRQGFYTDLGDADPALCTDPGGKGSFYSFFETPALAQDQLNYCLNDLLNDGITASRPVNINSQLENDCLVKYIIRELNLDSGEERNYVIGMQDTTTQGVWEWTRAISSEYTAVEQSHWAPEQPDGDVDENCAFLRAGTNYHNSGFWEDTDCFASGFYIICEQYLIAGPATTAAPTTAPAGTTAGGGGGTTAGGGTTGAGTTAAP